MTIAVTDKPIIYEVFNIRYFIYYIIYISLQCIFKYYRILDNWRILYSYISIAKQYYST
jgi:hypothetical protein